MKHYFIFKDFIEIGLDKGERIWGYIKSILTKTPVVRLNIINKWIGN